MLINIQDKIDTSSSIYLLLQSTHYTPYSTAKRKNLRTKAAKTKTFIHIFFVSFVGTMYVLANETKTLEFHRLYFVYYCPWALITKRNVRRCHIFHTKFRDEIENEIRNIVSRYCMLGITFETRSANKMQEKWFQINSTLKFEYNGKREAVFTKHQIQNNNWLSIDRFLQWTNADLSFKTYIFGANRLPSYEHDKF